MAHEFLGVCGGVHFAPVWWQCSHLFDALAQTGISFYLPLKEASPAESGAQHSLPSHHHIASAFQSTKRGQWGWRWGTSSTSHDICKCWSIQQQLLQKMFFSLFTTILIHAAALLSQAGLQDVLLGRLISIFSWSNLWIFQLIFLFISFMTSLTSFAHTEHMKWKYCSKTLIFQTPWKVPASEHRKILMNFMLQKDALKSKWIVSDKKLNKSSLLPWLSHNELGSF